MDRDEAIRKQLVDQLGGGGAHVGLGAVIDGLPARLRGQRPEGLPHSMWELLEHVRLCQWDILEYSRRPDHETPPWPHGFWPDGPAPPTPQAWERSVRRLLTDLEAMQRLLADPSNDPLQPIPWGKDPSHTLLRQAILLIDHNGYHLGQMADVRRALGAWG